MLRGASPARAVLRANTTINVPADYATLALALAYAATITGTGGPYA